MTWQGAAVGIPVWVGAVVTGNLTSSAWSSSPGVAVVGSLNPLTGVSASGRFCSIADAYINLNNPDTCAMYLRRLALALGCPEEDAANGVGFSFGDGQAIIVAGIADGGLWPWGPEVFPNQGRSRLEALALAWPADKRVTT